MICHYIRLKNKKFSTTKNNIIVSQYFSSIKSSKLNKYLWMKSSQKKVSNAKSSYLYVSTFFAWNLLDVLYIHEKIIQISSIFSPWFSCTFNLKFSTKKKPKITWIIYDKRLIIFPLFLFKINEIIFFFRNSIRKFYLVWR